MSPSYKNIVEELELVEENKVQKVFKGSKINAPDQLVLINKFNKSEAFNLAFKELLDNSLQHKLHIEETKDEIILVTKLIEGDNLSLFLNFSNSNEEERIDYVYDYLHQSIAYIGFDNFLINILVDQNQVIFKDNQLYIKESLIIDRRLDKEMPFSIVSKKIGHTMQRILSTSFRELRITKKHDDLIAFADKLIRRDNQYKCIDDIFSAFKAIYFENSTEPSAQKVPVTSTNVLSGQMHPNNMIFESLEDSAFTKALPKASEIKKAEKKIHKTTTVTHEERAILTGPIEESIDLDKLLSGVSSLDELIVEEKETYGIPEALKDTSLKVESNYGIPEALKSSNKTREKNRFKTIAVEVPEEDDEEDDRRHTKINFTVPLIALSAIILALVIYLSMPIFFPNSEDLGKRPVAEFEIKIENGTFTCINKSFAFGRKTIDGSSWKVIRNNKMEGETTSPDISNLDIPNYTDGQYEIELVVMDSEGLYSDPYKVKKEYLSTESKALENQLSTEVEVASNKAYQESDEPLDAFTIEATVNVKEDYDVKLKGNRSFKAKLAEYDGTASLSFTDISIDKKSTLSFHLMSNDKKNEINIQLIGYKDGENVFSKTIKKTPSGVLTWMQIATQVDLDDGVTADKLVIRFTSDASVIYFEDLSIKAYK